MDDIQLALDGDLKSLGFKKFGRTYNRSHENGIVQVINLQMGMPQPAIAGLPPEAAYLRPDLYGQFTVNIGVFVAEIAPPALARKSSRYVQEPRCSLRARLGNLMESERRDILWRLDTPTSAIVEDVKEALFRYGIPFLTRFATRSAIITGWIAFNERELRLSQRPRLDVAIMLDAAGDKGGAVDLLRQHLSLPSLNPHHSAYVRELAQELGLGELE
ncbi:MAG TPA: DUF4304 domain-containing protein [Rhizomicrobium sp.]|jgi:hypothetical protein